MTTEETNPSRSWAFDEGDEIAPGRYSLRRLGGGGRYEAYLAWDERLFTTVVAKVIRPHKAEDARAINGLAREVELLERLNHPGIPRSFDAVLDGRRPHVVLEHIEGPRLSTLLRKFGPLWPEQLVPLAMQVCGVLHYLSVKRVVHMDVKPSNIVMGPIPKLIDFSIARTAEDADDVDSPVGTDLYMSPEQCAPSKGAISFPTDVWGLGATLYHAVTREVPFPRTDDASRWPQLDEPAPLVPKDVAPALGQLIMWCLQKDAAKRPTAAQLAEGLEPLLAALPRKPILGKLKPRLR
jgi:serine/threonine protein kinase